MAITPRADRDPRYDEEKREQAAALYAEHSSVRAVAAEMGLSARRVWELLRDAGVEMRPVGRPKGEKA
jgi:transposase-like protein